MRVTEKIGLEVLISWEPTWDGDSLEEWEPTREPVAYVRDEGESAIMLDDLLAVEEEEVAAWDAKVDCLLHAVPVVGQRFIVSSSGRTCSGEIVSLDGDSAVVRVLAGEDGTITVARDDILSLAPKPGSAKVRDQVRVLMDKETDERSLRVWDYGRITKVLSGGEVVVVKSDRDGGEQAYCLFDVQDAYTHQWLAILD